MSSRRLRALACSIIITASIGAAPRAYAFDPFTIAAVVSAGAQAVSAISDAAGEVAASADAFSELYGEIDSDASVAEDGQRLVQEIREIEDLAYEAGYTKDEVEQLTTDAKNGSDGQKLSTTIKAITRAVRAGKRVARLVMKLEKKAQLAQVEQAATSREQLIALYKQIRLEHERDLNAIKEKLRELKDKHDQIMLLKKEEKNSGAQTFGRTGVLTFPKQESVIEEAIKMATQMRPFLLQLVLFVFLVRTIFYQFGLFESSRYGTLIRDGILCALLLMIFPELVRASVALCNDLASKVGLKELHDVEPGHLDFPVEIGLTIKTRLVLEWVFQWIKYIAFVIASFLANFGLAFLILMFPLVIFCSQMLGFAVAWPIFLGGFLAVCLWPLFWNATGSIALMLWRKQNASISDQIATILFSLLQFLSPLIGVATLKGQPLSKSVQRAASAVAGAVSSGVSTVASQVAGVVKGAAGAEGGGTLGRALAYPINQTAGRVMAGGLRGAEAARTAREQGAKSHWETGAKPPVLGKMLKASAAGFMTNHAKAPEKPGLFHAVKQGAQGMRHRPVLHGSVSGSKGSGANASAVVSGGPVKSAGGSNVRKS